MVKNQLVMYVMCVHVHLTPVHTRHGTHVYIIYTVHPVSSVLLGRADQYQQLCHHSLYSLNLLRLLDLLPSLLNSLIPTTPCPEPSMVPGRPGSITLDDCTLCFGLDSVSDKAGGILFTGAQCMDYTVGTENNTHCTYTVTHQPPATAYTCICVVCSQYAAHSKWVEQWYTKCPAVQSYGNNSLELL